tara:strand:- start:36726 stop:36995 length:270 start_codon:yes stop_codon:yes gene_type:complete
MGDISKFSRSRLEGLIRELITQQRDASDAVQDNLFLVTMQTGSIIVSAFDYPTRVPPGAELDMLGPLVIKDKATLTLRPGSQITVTDDT